jgi:hypothetical protein
VLKFKVDVDGTEKVTYIALTKMGPRLAQSVWFFYCGLEEWSLIPGKGKEFSFWPLHPDWLWGPSIVLPSAYWPSIVLSSAYWGLFCWG